MNDREYKKHKRALVNHAMLMSVEGLKSCIIDELESSKLPYLVFDAMTTALQKKLGTKEYVKWSNSLITAKGETK